MKKINFDWLVQNKKGFNLIELLVVMSIIALLSLVIVLNYNISRKKARDAQRKKDISEMSSALESYKTDAKSYITSTFSGSEYNFDPASGLAGLVPKYISQISLDPQGGNYFFKSDGQQYKIRALSEGIKETDAPSVAKSKAGDYYNPIPDYKNYFQVSSSNTALTTW